MIEVNGYKAFYGSIQTDSSGIVGPCDFLFDPEDRVWRTNDDEFYEFDVLAIMPYVNISKCNKELGNPDCDTHDNCFYEVVEVHENVTVEVLRCKNCGKIELSWYKDTPDDLDVNIEFGGLEDE